MQAGDDRHGLWRSARSSSSCVGDRVSAITINMHERESSLG